MHDIPRHLEGSGIQRSFSKRAAGLSDSRAPHPSDGLSYYWVDHKPMTPLSTIVKSLNQGFRSNKSNLNLEELGAQRKPGHLAGK